MKHRRLIVITALIVAVGIAAGWIWLRYRSSGFSAQQSPSSLEKLAAVAARKVAIPPRAKNLSNPLPNTSEIITQGEMHWADHCATCHANDGSGETEMGAHMYPRAPDMRKQETQNLTDGELYFIIQNGIRLSGMPAWGKVDDDADQDSWKLVRFIRYLPSLTPEEIQQMKHWNPVSPQEIQSEREEENFLGGGSDKAPSHRH